MELVPYVGSHPDHPLKARALARALDVPGEEYAEFRQRLRDLVDEGVLALGQGRAIVLPQQAGMIVGTFRANRRGFGFVEVPGRPDIFIPHGRTHAALEGDTVAVRLLRGAHGESPGGEVARVVRRAPIAWVGVLERMGNEWLVRPQGRAAAPVVRIDDPTAKSTRPADLVVVEPLEHTLGSERVRGVIVERLGEPTQTQTAILGVIRRFAIADRFPPEVRAAAQHAVAAFDPQAGGDREDLRDLLTITIDPVDARDFDDAISIEPLPRERVRLGVHIADVAHFVREGDPLDLEARRRGNSAYFPGYVAPMLPEVLSNGVCSLQPDQPRLAQSVFLTYDAAARVVERRFARSVIRSSARLTYEQASAVLDGQPSELALDVVELLERAGDLARHIRKRRVSAGMLALNLPEVDIRLDGDGNVVDAAPADTSFSHTLIEMFMVEANEAVSAALHERSVPHLRRVHAEPDPEAGAALARLLAPLGLRLPGGFDRPGILALLDAVRGKPEEPAVNLLLLRSLAKAAYSPEALGHFALASEHYCHFTSPIRRYPDLVVHRLFVSHLVDGPSHPRRTRREAREDYTALTELGAHASRMERVAQDAERDARHLLLMRLMARHVGERFEGLVTGVASFGLFVQVRPHLAEGVVRRADLGPDMWRFDARRGVLVGERSRRMFCIGQPVAVRVVAVDEVRQEMELVLEAGGAPIRGDRGSERVDGEAPRSGTGRRKAARGGRQAESNGPARRGAQRGRRSRGR